MTLNDLQWPFRLTVVFLSMSIGCIEAFLS